MVLRMNQTRNQSRNHKINKEVNQSINLLMMFYFRACSLVIFPPTVPSLVEPTSFIFCLCILLPILENRLGHSSLLEELGERGGIVLGYNLM